MNKLIFVLSLILIHSCTEKGKVADQMKDIPDAKWSYFQIPDFPFQVEDAGVYHDFYLKLRIQKSYLYENLYLLAHIKGPDGKVNTQRINFTLTDASGKPLGNSSSNAVNYELPMFKDRRMPGVGQYSISLEQNMRDSVILGVESIGVKIKKGTPIF